MSNMVVRTNIFSLNAHRNLKNVGLQQRTAAKRLASGYRINSAADDAAGLAISETMRAQIRGLDRASHNVQDAIALIQTADGGLAEVSNMIQRIRELAVQAANDTNVTVNREALAYEVFQLTAEIRATGNRVQFNGRNILLSKESMPGAPAPGTDVNPSFIGELNFQIGPNSNQMMNVGIDIMEVFSWSSYVEAGVDFLSAISFHLNHVGLAMQGRYGENTFFGTWWNYTSQSINDIDSSKTWQDWSIEHDGLSHPEKISAMLGNVDTNMRGVMELRTRLGAAQNRLEHTMRSLDISSENLQDAESRIRNTDMAREMMRFTMANVLQQASVSMLSQANSLPNNLLQLLR